MSEAAGVFERLAQGYALMGDERLIAGAGAYRLGAVAIVFPSRAVGTAFVEANGQGLATLASNISLTAIDDPFAFMRRAAGEGLCGFQGYGRCDFEERFMFMTRVEEAGHLLPTVLSSIGPDGWGPSLTRTGIRQLGHSELLHWNRFDILDSRSGEWGHTLPFRQWEQGGVFYELRSEGAMVVIAEVPLMGDWISAEGAFAFFTEKQSANAFLHERLRDGQTRVLFRPGSNPESAKREIRPMQIPDLAARLEELRDFYPFASYAINPDNHREDSAYGRLSDSDFRLLHSVSGTWEVGTGNRIERVASFSGWSGRDTIGWSGSQSLQLRPLDRSFASQQRSISGFDGEALTDSERDEVVQDFLSDGCYESLCQRASDRLYTDDALLERFFVVAWDAVTGERMGSTWAFDSFHDALQLISAYEREFDLTHRRDGAHARSVIGFAGSGNHEEESILSDRFRLGLQRLGQRILSRGYRPGDTANLVSLCNATLRTLHVDFAGFAKDLLWTSDDSQVDQLIEQLGLDEESARAWWAGAEIHVDPSGAKAARMRMGDEAWSRLTARSRHFIATALVHLESQGSAPQLDYAPINLGIVKALEVELVAILQAFAETLEGQVPDYDPEDPTDKTLLQFITQGRKPTLGAMAYLLRRQAIESSPLRRALGLFIESLPNAGFLRSSHFGEKVLHRAIHKYRNGGVHEARIAEEVCRECVDVIVGTAENQGALAKVCEYRAEPSE